MRCRFVIRLAGTLAALAVGQQAYACACTDEEIALSVREADRVFRGYVVSAQIADSTPRTIAFTVRVSDRIRGDTADTTSLETAMPEDCGATVEPGAHALFIVAAGDNTVNACTGLLRDPSRRVLNALGLVMYVGGSSKPHTWLNIYSEDDLDDSLDLAQRIDPDGPRAIRDEKGARYGNVRFILRDGIVEDLEIVE